METHRCCLDVSVLQSVTFIADDKVKLDATYDFNGSHEHLVGDDHDWVVRQVHEVLKPAAAVDGKHDCDENPTRELCLAPAFKHHANLQASSDRYTYLHLGVWRNGVDFEPLAAQPLLELAQPILSTNDSHTFTHNRRYKMCMYVKIYTCSGTCNNDVTMM